MEIKMTAIPGRKSGKVGKISISVGDTVSNGDVLVQVETAKGNRPIKATQEGIITKIMVQEGDEVLSNQSLFEVEHTVIQEQVTTVKIDNPKNNTIEIKMSAIPGGKSGKVGKISVSAGDEVSVGDILAQVETAKGNRPIKTSQDGIITKVMVQEGDEVFTNQTLFEVESEIGEPAPILIEDETINNLDTELLIIGAGPGGYVAAIYAAKKGLKVTLIEKKELGGTCLNVGCIPTKTLVKSSEVCQTIRQSSTFGIDLDGQFSVDMKKIIGRKDEVKEKLVSGIHFLMEKNQIQVIKGQASFLTSDEIFVKGLKNYKIKFKDVIIATGSKISKVNIQGIDLPFVMNSTDALACTDLPETITVIGGGVIGMEFAFIYANLGVKVHVVEYMDRLLTMVDEDISQEIREEAEKVGISVHTSAKVTQIQGANDGQAIVTYNDKDGDHLLISDKVLVAIGREPNIDGLDIEKADVTFNKRGNGIAVNDQMRTSKEHIYAIGDVTDILQLAHVASHQGIVAVENILGDSKDMNYSAVPNVIFTSPEIATVGLSEADCKKKEMDYLVSKVSFMSNGKALAMNQSEGFIKLIKDKSTNKIVGGSIIGPDASTLIATLTLGISSGITDKEFTEMIFAHPTTSEVLHESAFGFTIGALHEA